MVDEAIQKVFTALKSVRWRDCDEDNRFQWYYAEEMHYVVQNKDTGAYWFVKAKSPASAYESVRRKLQ